MFKLYTIEGTPEPSRGILCAIIAGKTKSVRIMLDALAPDDKINWIWEPYCTIRRTDQLDTLKLVLDDPHFLFSAHFFCSCCYFTNRELRDLVLNHPRAQ